MLCMENAAPATFGGKVPEHGQRPIEDQWSPTRHQPVQ